MAAPRAGQPFLIMGARGDAADHALPRPAARGAAAVVRRVCRAVRIRTSMGLSIAIRGEHSRRSRSRAEGRTSASPSCSKGFTPDRRRRARRSADFELRQPRAAAGSGNSTITILAGRRLINSASPACVPTMQPARRSNACSDRRARSTTRPSAAESVDLPYSRNHARRYRRHRVEGDRRDPSDATRRPSELADDISPLPRARPGPRARRQPVTCCAVSRCSTSGSRAWLPCRSPRLAVSGVAWRWRVAAREARAGSDSETCASSPTRSSSRFMTRSSAARLDRGAPHDRTKRSATSSGSKQSLAAIPPCGSNWPRPICKSAAFSATSARRISATATAPSGSSSARGK